MLHYFMKDAYYQDEQNLRLVRIYRELVRQCKRVDFRLRNPSTPCALLVLAALLLPTTPSPYYS